MNIYKKFSAKKYSFLVDDTIKKTFWNKFSKIIYNKIMKIDDQIKDKKLQYNINVEDAKISALSSDKFKNTNILQVKNYCLQIKNKFFFLLWVIKKKKKTHLKNREKNKSKPIKVKIPMTILNEINYCFQSKEKYLRIFIMKELKK